jgi:hypothetical protein
MMADNSTGHLQGRLAAPPDGGSLSSASVNRAEKGNCLWLRHKLSSLTCEAVCMHVAMPLLSTINVNKMAVICIRIQNILIDCTFTRKRFKISASKLIYYSHSLTSWSRILLEKLTGAQLVKKLSAISATRRFITAFTSTRHMSLS